MPSGLGGYGMPCTRRASAAAAVAIWNKHAAKVVQTLGNEGFPVKVAAYAARAAAARAIFTTGNINPFSKDQRELNTRLAAAELAGILAGLRFHGPNRDLASSARLVSLAAAPPFLAWAFRFAMPYDSLASFTAVEFIMMSLFNLGLPITGCPSVRFVHTCGGTTCSAPLGFREQDHILTCPTWLRTYYHNVMVIGVRGYLRINTDLMVEYERSDYVQGQQARPGDIGFRGRLRWRAAQGQEYGYILLLDFDCNPSSAWGGVPESRGSPRRDRADTGERGVKAAELPAAVGGHQRAARV